MKRQNGKKERPFYYVPAGTAWYKKWKYSKVGRAYYFVKIAVLKPLGLADSSWYE